MAHYSECKLCLKPMEDCFCLLSTKGTSKKEESNGGSSSYYKLKIRTESSKVSKIEGHNNLVDVEIETGDIIRQLVGNDFDLGNIIKACRRMHLASNGGGKEGTSVEYDTNKVRYFVDSWFNNYQMEQI